MQNRFTYKTQREYQEVFVKYGRKELLSVKLTHNHRGTCLMLGSKTVGVRRNQGAGPELFTSSIFSSSLTETIKSVFYSKVVSREWSSQTSRLKCKDLFHSYDTMNNKIHLP